MLNNKGISFAETLLTAVILFILAGTLIPFTYHLKETLYNQKLELHASETALEVAKRLQTESLKSGKKTIEQIDYHWTYDGQKICVTYRNGDDEKIKCIGRKEEIY
ncbi:hypothetical protein ACH0B5_07480 [Ureibacillus sp. 179-F W5.1 NHS]|uniref:Type II secretion system protein n=1 Tax=Lysinibacillus halotolerans TaxID=1368476 RepID=A0A3M8H9V6_9BACI|nr:hypothetical protein [Lysinibacillus halotolerans]RNC99217.1 hypothetical protein EC501_08590 [Lysinibacillus halotolerans]